MGIAEFPIKVESTTVSTEHFYHLLNFFIFDGTGKQSHFIMVDCLFVIVVAVLFHVLECIVGTNVGSCHFAEASHFSFVISFGSKHPRTSCKNEAFFDFNFSGLERYHDLEIPQRYSISSPTISA